MKTLRVHVDYGYPESPGSAPLALPIRVLDSESGIVAEGAADRDHPAAFAIRPGIDPVFVRIIWPSGKTGTQRAKFDEAGRAEMHFTDAEISRNEWAAWAVPRLNRESSLVRQTAPPGKGIAKFSNVWLRLWKFENDAWRESSIRPTAAYGSELAKQIDLQLEQASYMLQFGGTTVPWQLVSLPAAGRCRALLTPNESGDPRSGPLKIVVTGFRPDAETLLEFLSRDALGAAHALAGFEPLAIRLLEEKIEDPIAAIAGAYFLLRTKSWNKVPEYWFDNLVEFFPWIADPPVIRCAVMLRRGLKDSDEESRALSLLEQCVNRGMPMFAEGLALMQEAASALRAAHCAEKQRLFDAIGLLAVAQAWAGAAFSFYGKGPNEPLPDKWAGYPSRGRPLKRARTANFLTFFKSDQLLEEKALAYASNAMLKSRNPMLSIEDEDQTGRKAGAVGKELFLLGHIPDQS